MNHNMYVLEYLKKTQPNEDYSKLEQYIKNYIQMEEYMNILQIKYNDIILFRYIKISTKYH